MNIVTKRVNERYTSNKFTRHDTERLINNNDKNENFRWIRATLVKWYDKFFINISFNRSNAHKETTKHIKDIVVLANDLTREIKFYDDRWCVTNCPLNKDAKYHHSEWVINKNKLESLEDIMKFME
jgi:hypothetical protein